MSKIIQWNVNDGFGTGLRGYYCSPWPFELTVAKLITASGQPAKSYDGYKTSVEFSGMFDGQPFTLYDYKEDREIHIGGHESLNITGLYEVLTAALGSVDPTPYEAKEYYDECVGHSWPKKESE